MLDSGVFAKALIERASQADIPVCNLKLQKLVYYCQGYYLATHNEPVLNSKIEAWQHGPVVRDLYFSYNHFGSASIGFSGEQIFETLPVKVKQVIDFVLDKFGKTPAWALRNQTHQEAPWRAHFSTESGVDNGEISQVELSNYFTQVIVDEQDCQLASILDSAEETELVEMPSNITSDEDFLAWIRSHNDSTA